MSVYPVCEFEHLDESFTWRHAVSSDHPLVAVRPDLFTAKKPTRATPPEEPKE